MKMKHALALLTLSTLCSAWLYWHSSSPLDKILTSKQWQSNLVAVMAANEHTDNTLGPLSRLEQSSRVLYSPNGEYTRESTLRLFGKDTDNLTMYQISEKGEWKISNDYLLISPKTFQDAESAQSHEFTPTQLALIKKFMRLEAQQSRRIDIVDDKTLLLTTLNQGSTVLFSN